MLVEAEDRGKIVSCLICNQPIPVPTPDGQIPQPTKKPAPTVTVPPVQSAIPAAIAATVAKSKPAAPPAAIVVKPGAAPAAVPVAPAIPAAPVAKPKPKPLTDDELLGLE